jgi:Uma2 family endonuclease
METSQGDPSGTHEPPVPAQEADVLLEGFLALETPEGFRAELIEGEIVVTPPPDGDHEDNIAALSEQILALSKVPMRASGNKGLRLASGGRCPSNHVIPDLTVAPRELRLFRGAEPWMPARNVALVVEVTSTRPERDRAAKRHCYARAGIPLYLLVDREKQRVTLMSEPIEDDYSRTVFVPFGEPLDLPSPFAFALETAEF